MSDTKQSDSDRALARLLGDALRPPNGGASDSACPEAELLAAYAEHNLDAAEIAQWEEHFAGCARCQKILAVLTVSGEEPLTVSEVESTGRKAAAAAAQPRLAVGSKDVVSFARRRTTWRWVAPAIGIAAAAALWIALRPAPPRGAAATTAQHSADQLARSSDESLEARANVPAPPADALRESAPQQQLKALRQAQSSAGQQEKKSGESARDTQVAEQAASGVGGGSAKAPAQENLQVRAILQSKDALDANSPQAKTAAAAPPAAPVDGLAARAPAPAAPAAPPVREAGGTGTGKANIAPAAAMPVPQAAGGVSVANADAATASQQTAAATSTEAEKKPAENRVVQAFGARAAVAGLAAAPPRLIVASPSGNVRWRFSAGGRIERSIDRGQTWQEQSGGVASDLLAGAAPSDKVAWIAGRAGTILRTTDGEHWQHVASPDATADWTGIQARDELRATVVSADRSRFTTDDGGRTWKQQ